MQSAKQLMHLYFPPLFVGFIIASTCSGLIVPCHYRSFL
uniref:Uncharacterized protein n=1 Tax=Arundo donax TaxID=35708 RepID=A0A0A9A6C4_ARUDO